MQVDDNSFDVVLINGPGNRLVKRAELLNNAFPDIECNIDFTSKVW